MRTFVIAIACLILTLSLPTVTSLDYREDKTHFDLVCLGSGRDSFQRPLDSMRISLDLEHGQFCIDFFCDRLTRVTDDKLEYACHGRDVFCEAGMGTGGPFVSQEDFVFDRVAGHFSRTSSGSVGDLDSKTFSASFSGSCTWAPFTALRSIKP